MPPKMKGKKGYLAERLLIKPALFSTFFFFFSLGGNPISFLLLASPIFSKKGAYPKINLLSTQFLQQLSRGGTRLYHHFLYACQSFLNIETAFLR